MRSVSSAARGCSLGSLLLLGLLVLSGLTFAGDTAPGPWAAPTVTATVPAAGAVQVPLATAIEVQFSEPMNATSIQYEVKPTPTVALTESWPSPDRFRIQPDPPGLAPCTAYSVQVAALDADEGLPLAPGPARNPWSFMTLCDRPFILSTSPANGTRFVRPDAEIVVTFSERMNTTSPAPIRLLPSPPSIRTFWDASRTVLTANTTLPNGTATLQLGTTYIVTVDAYDEDQGYRLVPGLLPNPFVFTVNAAPAITAPVIAAGSCFGSGTSLVLDWTMADDRDPPANLTVQLTYLNGSREEAILGPARGFPSPASHLWSLPAVDLRTRVRLRVTDTTGGVSIAHSEEFTIDTGPPRVILTNPAHGATDVPVGATIAIVFSEPMNLTTVERAIASDPPLGGAQFQRSPDNRSITVLPGGMRDRTSYRITVGAGVLDRCGPGRPMGSDFTFSFTTARAPSAPPALLWATEITETSVSLAWEPVTTFVTGTPIPPEATITYRVFRSQDVRDVGELVIEVNGTRAIDRRLRPSTTYVYTVRAVVDGVPSAPTAALIVTTRDPFFATAEGRLSVLAAFLAASVGIAAGVVQWGKRRRAEAQARLAQEIQDVVEQVRDVRAETDPVARQEKEEALQEHFRNLVEGFADGEEGRPDSRLEGLYRALAAALVQSPEVDVASGRSAVDRRLGDLAEGIRTDGATYRLLSEAEASVASDLFRGLPESGKKALLLVYFYALEEYLGRRLRALIPAGATVLLGERGHINVRRRGWRGQWASLSLGTLVYLADRNRHFFVANDARWEDEVEPLLRAAVEARNKTAHPSEAPPELARVRRLVYESLIGLEAVLRRRPTSGVAA